MKNTKAIAEPFKAVKDERLYYFKAKVTDVLDGDTLKLEYIDLGFGMAVMEATLRISGIDAPEIHSDNEKEAKAAGLVRDYLIGLVGGKICTIKTVKDSEKSKEKFGRYLCDVYLSESETVSKRLVSLGFVRAYKGEKKLIWTDAELDLIIQKLSK